MKLFVNLFVAMSVFSLFGCVHTAYNHIPTYGPVYGNKNLVVFLDGTANSEVSHTNIAKLHNLITLQSRPDISATYIKGVGTGIDVVGMAFGGGIGADVREAYKYLCENYNPESDDKIFIFGFSRGAYAARILAALIYVAGIQDLRNDPDEQDNLTKQEKRKREREKGQFVSEIYSAYKSTKSISERRKDVYALTRTKYRRVEIEFMGLWDTVEALGLPDYKEDFVHPNNRYADQLCNIKKAAHAVSIDDDRARVFTPILLTRKHLISDCKEKVIDNFVEEVWFSGAHADVGGGYKNTQIGGVSLNWMLSRIETYKLLPKNTRVYANPYDKTNDPEEGLLWGLLYHRVNRNLDAYSASEYNHGRLKIHQSVLDRVACVPIDWHELNLQKVYPKSLRSQNNRICRKPGLSVHQLEFDVVSKGYNKMQCLTKKRNPINYCR